MSLLPDPGSLEARVDGCTCPPAIDDGGFTTLQIGAGCPLHDDQAYARPHVEAAIRNRTETYGGAA